MSLLEQHLNNIFTAATYLSCGKKTKIYLYIIKYIFLQNKIISSVAFIFRLLLSQSINSEFEKATYHPTYLDRNRRYLVLIRAILGRVECSDLYEEQKRSLDGKQRVYV